MVLSKVIKMCVTHGWNVVKRVNWLLFYMAPASCDDAPWPQGKLKLIDIIFNVLHIHRMCACARIDNTITMSTVKLRSLKMSHIFPMIYFESEFDFFGSFVNWWLNEFRSILATNRFRQLIFFSFLNDEKLTFFFFNSDSKGDAN